MGGRWILTPQQTRWLMDGFKTEQSKSIKNELRSAVYQNVTFKS